MCESKAEGGRRCAAHTRPAYQQAVAAITDTHLRDLPAAIETHKRALIDYATTPTGAAEYAAFSRHLREELTRLQPHARAMFEDVERAKAALDLTDTQVQIRTEIEETVRRRLRWERTGTHAEQPSAPTR